jgi:hypothetical protein
MHARRVGVRRRINSGKQATPVTLGYRKSVISSGSLRYLELDAGVGRTPQKSHNSAARRPIPTGSPRTKRHTPVHLLCV